MHSLNDEQATRLSQRAYFLLTNGSLEPPINEKIAVILRSTRKHWTRHCLRTLFHCTAQKLNVTVVPDESGRCAAADLEQIVEPYVVKVLHPAPGVDLLNLALSFVKEPFFVLLDDSVTVTPGWLSKLLWPFWDDPQIMLSSPISNLALLGENPHLEGHATIRIMFEWARQIVGTNAGLWTEDAEPAWACMLGRSRLLSDVGGLDFSLPNHTVRMTDWYVRARSIGYRSAVCRDAYIHILKRIPSGDGNKISAWDKVAGKWNLPSAQHLINAIHNSGEIMLFPLSDICISLSKEHIKPPMVSVILFIDSPGLENVNPTLLSIRQQNYQRMEIIAVGKSSNRELFQPHAADFIQKQIWLDEELFRENVYKSVWSLASGDYVMYVHAGEALDADHIRLLIEGIHSCRDIAFSRISLHAFKNKDQIPLKYLIHVHPDKSKTALKITFHPVPSLLVPFELGGLLQ